MAVTTTTRLGIIRWSAGGDALLRTQMDNSHAALETLTAIYLQGLAGDRPAAGTAGRFYYATDTKVHTYDDGSGWRAVTGGASNDGTKLLSLGGNLTVSGAYTTTLTVTNNTSVTLPTSGTLINDAVTTLNSLVSIDTTSTAGHTVAIGTGATLSGQTKTVNIGGGGVGGSTTAITLGPTTGTVTTTLNGLVSLANTADTATAATHYYTEIGTDGYIRPKTLANVKTEIVTNAAVNSAAATTVGTVTTGTWNASVIDGARGGTGVANTGKTITVSGNVSIGSTTDTVTFTTAGNTSLALPTSGTLVNSAVTSLSSLATVGTIGTGTWQGTVVSPTYGGTGVNNGSKTLTLSGVTAIGSSTHTVTFATTGNTNVTFPTSGTLVSDSQVSLNSVIDVDTTRTDSHTLSLGTGATTNGSTKTVNIGTGGVAGSVGTITLGAAAATNTVTLNGLTSLAYTSDTATAATHYFVETATDGYLRPKLLADVKSEIVTQAAVEAVAIRTVGTIGSGTWNATAIADGKIASTLTGKTYNGLSLTAAATGFTIAGGTTSKTLTVSNTLTLAGTDAASLNIGAGGTLGSAAFTASNTYAPAAGSSSIVTVGTVTSGVWSAGTNSLTAGNLTGTIPSTVLGNSSHYIGTTQIALNAGSGTVTSLAGLTGVTATTFTGALSGNASTATKWASAVTLTIGNSGKSVDGSGGVTWSLADIGGTTVGQNLFTLTNPSAITFPRINANNTVDALSATNFRTAIGSTTVGSNLFTLSNPSAITYLRINADNTVTTLSKTDFRTDLNVNKTTVGTTDSPPSGEIAGDVYINSTNGKVFVAT